MLEFDTYASKVFGRDLAPYSVASECDAESGEYLLKFSAVEEIENRFAIICGDVVHSLKTALDFAWYELTASDDPGPKHRIKFPIYPTRKQLEDFIDSRPQQQSVIALSGKLLDVIKPYKGGNLIGDILYALHELDTRYKHRLIPQVQASHVWHDGADDSTNEGIVYGPDLINTHGVKTKYQGELSASIIFGEGAEPVEGQSVAPTLRAFETAVNATLMILR